MKVDYEDSDDEDLSNTEIAIEKKFTKNIDALNAIYIVLQIILMQNNKYPFKKIE